MPITFSTTYTKERLLRFNNYVAGSRKLTWILQIILNVLTLGAYVFLRIIGQNSFTLRVCLLLVLVYDLVLPFCYFVLPRITVSKSKGLNAVICYTFDENGFRMEASTAYVTESSAIQYAMLTRAVKKGQELYMFISYRQAYLADLSALPAEQLAMLKALLDAHLPPRKVQWR